MDERLVQFDEKMQKTMNNLSEEFGSIRAGRANPHVLDKLKVDYYGTPTAIQQDPAMGSFYGKRNRESDLNVRSWNQSDK